MARIAGVVDAASRRHSSGALAALLLCGLASAADLPPPPKVLQHPSPAVADQGISAKFAVERLKNTMLPGDEMGHVSSGFFCGNRRPLRISENHLKNFGAFETSVVTQFLKKSGFPMAIPVGPSAYATDPSAAPDFRIGGIVREVRVETCRGDNEAEGWVYLKVDWALFSEREQRVVFQRTTEGLGFSDKRVPDLPRKAVESTIQNFIAAPEFLAAVKPDAQAPVALPAAEAPASDAAGAGSALAVGADSRGSAAVQDSRQPPTVVAASPIKVGDQSLGVKLAVDPLKIGMLQGDELGHVASGVFCKASQVLTAAEHFMKTYGSFVASVATQALKKNGYPLASQARTSAFDTEQSTAPDFRLGGVLKDLRIEVCESGAKAEGWIYARIDWALYSDKAKRVVFQQMTEGVAQSRDKVPDLPRQALTMAVENLLAAPELLAALKSTPGEVAGPGGGRSVPVAAASSAADAGAGAPPATADARGEKTIRLAGAPPLPGGAQKNQAKLRASVVTLETAHGTGSGFYIDRAGYLLTDFHVVKGARFVKVKLSNGDKLVAQVVKFSEPDDVALLKSPAVDLDPLAIRSDALDVGEEVYAIGTPLGVLTSTMTRGVLSADRVRQGVHELQSDAAVTFGSSGGPLLDSEGRVIGLTKSGVLGFNFFIPVQDALRALDVTIGTGR